MRLTSVSGTTIAAAAATLMLGTATVVAQSQTPAQNQDGTVNCYIGDAKEPQAIPMSECEEKNGSLTPPADQSAQQPATGQTAGTVNCYIGDAKQPQAIPMSECEEKNGSLTPPDGQTTAQQPAATPSASGQQSASTVNCYIDNAQKPEVIAMSECEEKGGKLVPPVKTALVRCYGVNSCAGKSGCKTAHSECAGKNDCAGKGFVEISHSECEEQGGKLQPPA